MAKNTNYVSHKKSKLKENGGPKLPLASALFEGEIAINFGKDVETLSIKNESGDVVTFSSDNYYTEKKLGSGFTSENSGVTVTEAIENSEEVSISSGVTPSGNGIEIWIDESEDPTEADVYTKAQTDSLLNLKLDVSAYTEYWTSGTGENAVVLKNSSGTASGDFSVAEGQQTSATSNCSHAEGYSTIASGSSSHAEGQNAKAIGNYSHAEGQNTQAIGNYSHAEGNATKTSGDSSHAEGSYTQANGQYSHAEGENTQAIGNHSHAEGQVTTASGGFSHAEGQDAKAIGNYSHAEGQGTTAGGYCSHSEGSTTNAGGDFSHAEGQNAKAIGHYSHAEGYSTTASGQFSHVEGQNTIASGRSSHAEGQNVKAYGDSSHAEGSYTQAIGQFSHVEGQSTIASGISSHAEGSNAKASGISSHAEGSYTQASGHYSHAEGGNTTANGQYSHVEGQNTIANNESEHASGIYNVSSSASTTFGDSGNTLFSVGNGTYQNRHNAFEIRQNGDIYIVSGNSDIKLQDYIGNSITVDQVLDDTTSASTNPVSSKAVYSAITDNELVWTNAFVALSGTVSAHTEDTEIHVTAADKTAWNAKVDASAIADFFDDAKYEDSGATKVINFYHGNTIKATIDASDFIVDGMVEDVRIENGNLVIDFNTASGKQDISIPLTDIFDPSNYYTKSETSGATEISNALGAKVDSATYIAHAADTTIHFTTGTVQTQIDNSISGKVNTSDIVTAITSSNSGSTAPIATKVVAENELIVSNALNDLEGRKADAEDLDGVKLKKITQSAYDALVQAGTTDPNTLYIITDNNS